MEDAESYRKNHSKIARKPGVCGAEELHRESKASIFQAEVSDVQKFPSNQASQKIFCLSVLLSCSRDVARAAKALIMKLPRRILRLFPKGEQSGRTGPAHACPGRLSTHLAPA
jgi:hypothetical protein